MSVTAGNADYVSANFTTAVPGTYRWTASYGGDGNNASVATACNDPNELVVVSKASPSLTTTASGSVAVGGTVSDTGHLTGGFTPTGTITFKLYGRGNTTCAGGPVFTSAVSVTAGNADYVSANYTPTVPGTYRWTASYGGNANNSGASGACNDANELVVVTKASPSLTTTASASVAVGGTVSDTGHLSGGFNPTGTTTFRLYGPANTTCAGAALFTSSVSVNAGNGDYVSGGFKPTVPGTYRWTASYGGDANNAAVATACNDPNESVTVNP